MLRHYLKDGTEVSTVAGKVIKADEYPIAYRVIERTKNDDIRRVKESE